MCTRFSKVTTSLLKLWRWVKILTFLINIKTWILYLDMIIEGNTIFPAKIQFFEIDWLSLTRTILTLLGKTNFFLWKQRFYSALFIVYFYGLTLFFDWIFIFFRLFFFVHEFLVTTRNDAIFELFLIWIFFLTLFIFWL